MMKIAAKVIKYILNDRRFKVFVAKCGHKGDISQWQEIHSVLLARHEALIKSSVEGYRTVDKDIK